MMKIFALLIGLLLLNCADAKQKYYKWTDADGNIHYTEKKPQNKKTSEVKVNTSKPQVNYNNKSQEDEEDQDGTNDERTSEQKAIEEFNEQEKARVTAAQNIENCKVAKKNYATLQKTVRVRQKNPETGEIIRIDSKQRMAMLERSKQSIKDLCQ